MIDANEAMYGLDKIMSREAGEPEHDYTVVVGMHIDDKMAQHLNQRRDEVIRLRARVRELEDELDRSPEWKQILTGQEP